MKVEGAGALISGGASGLGAAATRRLHAGGAQAADGHPNAGQGDALASELGERAGFVEADVTDEAAVQGAVDAAAQLDGGPRISVCCAGIGWAQRTTGKQGPHPLELFEKVVEVNLVEPNAPASRRS